MPVEKVSEKYPKTAVVTLHPYLPSEADQLAGARDWGLPELQNGGDGKKRLDIWFDDVRNVRTTNWPSKLPAREVLLRQYRTVKLPNNEVYFANPLCVGFSEKHARDVLATIHGTGALAYVHDMQREFRPGDDLAPFFAEHKRQLKNAQQGKWRGDQKSK